MSDVPGEPSISVAKVHALIVAAGRGSRFGGPMPKQYRRLGNRSVLRHSVMAFLDHPRIDSVRVAIHPDDIALYRVAMGGLDLPEPVAGGATRQESVRALIEAAGASEGDVILIHDAARPFVSPSIIDRAIDAALRAGAGAVAIPVTDTLKRADGDYVGATVDRAGLWRAQTPQSFRFGLIRAAHEAAVGRELTDDAAVAEHAGHRVGLVMGHEDNFKITTEADLLRAENLLFVRLGDVRSGTGFDVHRFTDGDFCWINGIRVPHAQSLLGHSDADVGLHAITDAILGALGAGDIGQHFPPTDARWRGAASDKFLRHAADLVAERGGVIAHVDVTIICERPKIGPHRPAMVTRIAEILEIAPDRVSVKATTTEELGFTGRREGIAAQAVATIRLPFAGFGGGNAG